MSKTKLPGQVNTIVPSIAINHDNIMSIRFTDGALRNLSFPAFFKKKQGGLRIAKYPGPAVFALNPLTCFIRVFHQGGLIVFYDFFVNTLQSLPQTMKIMY